MPFPSGLNGLTAGTQGMPSPSGTPMPPPMAALRGARQATPEGLGPDAERNPMGTDRQTKEFFVDRDMFKTPVKKGDKVTITGTVTTTGLSIGITPDSATPAKQEGGEKEYDGELDDDLADSTPTGTSSEVAQQGS